MRSGSTCLAVALAIVVALLLCVPGPVVAGHASLSVASEGRIGSPRPSGLIYIAPTNQFNDYEPTFDLGDHTGVYFSIDDYANDAFATVTITDPNATRDGVPTPAASWTVAFNASTGGSYFSSEYGIAYFLPTSLVFSGEWDLSVSGRLGGNDTVNFWVQTYSMTLGASADALLPGQSGSVSFLVASTLNGALYDPVSSVVLTAQYSTSTTEVKLALVPSVFRAGTTYGTSNFTLPSNASYPGEVDFTGYANVSNGGNYSVGSFILTYISAWAGGYVGLSCPGCYNPSGNSWDVPVGAAVELSATANVETAVGQSNPVNVPVFFSYWSGPTLLPYTAVPGDPPNGLLTNSQGAVSVLFLATSPFSTTLENRIEASFLFLDAPGAPKQWFNVSLYMNLTRPVASGATMSAGFNSTEYFGGDTAEASWQIAVDNSSTGSGWTGTYYQVWEAPNYRSGQFLALLAQAPISGLAGTISFPVPLNFSGELVLYAYGGNATTTLSAFAEVSDTPPVLYLDPSEFQYSPGDTITFSMATAGTAFVAATVYYAVYDSNGYVVTTGSTSPSGTIAFRAASPYSPPSYRVTAVAESPTLGVIASTYYTIDAKSGYALTTSVTTPSNYEDGSYQPGQTLSFGWSLATVANSPLPRVVYLLIANVGSLYSDYLGYESALADLTVASTSGAWQYTLPSNAPAGTETLVFELSIVSGPCVYGCIATSEVSFTVNPNPSVFERTLGSDTGLTVGWVIVLATVVIVAALLVLALRRRHGGGTAATPSTESSDTAGTTPSAATPSEGGGRDRWLAPFPGEAPYDPDRSEPPKSP
jgi:hypothetical protein